MSEPQETLFGLPVLWHGAIAPHTSKGVILGTGQAMTVLEALGFVGPPQETWGITPRRHFKARSLD